MTQSITEIGGKVGVLVCDGVAVDVFVAVAVLVGVHVVLGVDVLVAVGVTVSGIAVAVLVGVRVAVAVRVAVTVGGTAVRVTVGGITTAVGVIPTGSAYAPALIANAGLFVCKRKSPMLGLTNRGSTYISCAPRMKNGGSPAAQRDCRDGPTFGALK